MPTGAAAARFLYAGAEMVGEYDGTNALQKRYIHGAGVDEVLVEYSGSGTAAKTWLVADARGSIAARTDGTGAATTINTYDPYGLPAAGNQGRFQYTGQMWLAEAGLYHYKARSYNPALGRFMQTDPLGYADGMNMYAYVGGDPVNARDPSGLEGSESCGDYCEKKQDGGGGAYKGMSLNSFPITISGSVNMVGGVVGGVSSTVSMGQTRPNLNPTHGSTIGSSSAEWVDRDRIVITGTRSVAWEVWPSGFLRAWFPGGGPQSNLPVSNASNAGSAQKSRERVLDIGDNSHDRFATIEAAANFLAPLIARETREIGGYEVAATIFTSDSYSGSPRYGVTDIYTDYDKFSVTPPAAPRGTRAVADIHSHPGGGDPGGGDYDGPIAYIVNVYDKTHNLCRMPTCRPQ